MAEAVRLEVQSRSGVGTSAARKLRREGIVPGNVFGHKQDAVAIQAPADAIRGVLHKGARLVELHHGGKAEQALVSEVQWDTFGQHLLHIDFLRVDPNERVRVKVPVHLRGTAPGVLAGGVLEQLHHEVMIECLAIEVPNEIIIKIGHLQVGEFVHVHELSELPQGVHVLDSPETVLVHIVQKREEVDLGTGVDGGPIEPELIGRKPKDDAAAG